MPDPLQDTLSARSYLNREGEPGRPEGQRGRPRLTAPEGPVQVCVCYASAGMFMQIECAIMLSRGKADPMIRTGGPRSAVRNGHID